MMRKTNRSGSVFLCFFINLLLNLEWCIPALVLLALHFWLDISIWWFVSALALWLIGILFWMLVMSWAGRCSNTPDPPKENKNPYSVGAKKEQ